MKNDEAINVFETYLATGHVPYPYELREASRMAISALKRETPLPEDTVLFNKGVEEGRRLAEEEQADLFTIVALDAAQRAQEQMMKEAVEAEYGYFSNASKTILPSGKLNIKEGDKVRIIIVKEEEK